jgi:ABC-2 type transport system permease protein
LPRWLNTLVHLNPITYAVHPMRAAVFEHVNANKVALAHLNPPLTWWGWPVPILVQLSVVAVTGLFFLWVAVLEFDRAD